jgi:hypothetical protein
MKELAKVISINNIIGWKHLWEAQAQLLLQ